MRIFILQISMHHVIHLLQCQIKLNIHYECKSIGYKILIAFFFKCLFFLFRNGLNYYRAQQVKIATKDILWKRSPEDYCQGSCLLSKKNLCSFIDYR